jgi:hypothetical protein
MPENEGYMIAAYVVAAVVYLVYGGSLLTRGLRALRQDREG